MIGKQSEPVENPVNVLVKLNFCVACDTPRTREASLSIPIAYQSLRRLWRFCIN